MASFVRSCEVPIQLAAAMDGTQPVAWPFLGKPLGAFAHRKLQDFSVLGLPRPRLGPPFSKPHAQERKSWQLSGQFDFLFFLINYLAQARRGLRGEWWLGCKRRERERIIDSRRPRICGLPSVDTCGSELSCQTDAGLDFSNQVLVMTAKPVLCMNTFVQIW